MLYRKISKLIEEHFTNLDNPILIIDGARQIGKSYIIREMAKSKFKNYIEINMYNDSLGDKFFAKVNSIDSFYLQVSMIAGDKLGKKEDTIICLDEIQVYPHLLTLLKFLKSAVFLLIQSLNLMLDGVFRLFLWIYEGIADGYSHPLSHQLGEIGIECMMRESAEVILTPLA